jgi:hypothetical protein
VAGQFIVVIKDATNSPLNNCAVTISFASCCNDIRLSTTQVTLGAGSLNAVAKTITVNTDVTGTATFRIEGAASQSGLSNTGATGAPGCASISATPSGGSAVLLTNGVDHGTVGVGTYDLDGAGGVGLNDLIALNGDKNAFVGGGSLPAAYRQRADFDRVDLAANVQCDFLGFSYASAPFGNNLGDIIKFNGVKNAAGSAANGPFVSCP